MVCTFFGHRECPGEVRPKLREALVDLIENHEVSEFYVGRQGGFDILVRSVLKELTAVYPHISYYVVLECVPSKRGEDDAGEFTDTILPEGIESVHPRFTIHWRNKWMIKQSDYVVTFITHSWGGAAQFAEMAKKQGKKMIELG